MNRPKDLHRLDVFHLTAKNKSFTKAAEGLNISGSMVSQHISKLENQLDIKLFNRSTRLVRLTEAGRLLYQASQDVFDRLEVAVSNIDDVKFEPSGVIRISAQSNFAMLYLIPLMNEFSQRFPDIGFDLLLDDQVQDLRQQSIDISFTVGEIENSDYYAIKLQEFELLICASPDYLLNREIPKTLEDLKNHSCILLSTLKNMNVWSFYNPDAELESVYIRSKTTTNSGQALEALARSGAGIAILPDLFAANALQNGSLIKLLPDYYSEKLCVYAVYHQQLHRTSFTIRCFIEFIEDAMKNSG